MVMGLTPSPDFFVEWFNEAASPNVYCFVRNAAAGSGLSPEAHRFGSIRGFE